MLQTEGTSKTGQRGRAIKAGSANCLEFGLNEFTTVQPQLRFSTKALSFVCSVCCRYSGCGNSSLLWVLCSRQRRFRGSTHPPTHTPFCSPNSPPPQNPRDWAFAGFWSWVREAVNEVQAARPAAVPHRGQQMAVWLHERGVLAAISRSPAGAKFLRCRLDARKIRFCSGSRSLQGTTGVYSRPAGRLGWKICGRASGIRPAPSCFKVVCRRDRSAAGSQLSFRRQGLEGWSPRPGDHSRVTGPSEPGRGSEAHGEPNQAAMDRTAKTCSPEPGDNPIPKGCPWQSLCVPPLSPFGFGACRRPGGTRRRFGRAAPSGELGSTGGLGLLESMSIKSSD